MIFLVLYLDRVAHSRYFDMLVRLSSILCMWISLGLATYTQRVGKKGELECGRGQNQCFFVY